jgi:phosphotriesterase-related protein
MADDGLVDRILLGMDAARRRYYRVFGGQPGLTYLLDGFSTTLDKAGVDSTTRDRLFIHNPARAFAFSAPIA